VKLCLHSRVSSRGAHNSDFSFVNIYCKANWYTFINFMLFIQCVFLHWPFLKADKINHLEGNKVDSKIHFISNANSYMFRHQGATIKEFINNKGLRVQQVFPALFALTLITKDKSLNMLKLHITYQQLVVAAMCSCTCSCVI